MRAGLAAVALCAGMACVTANGLPPGDGARIAVTSQGLYRLSPADIAGCLNGVSVTDVVDAIAATNISLSNLGRGVAWLADTNAGGIAFYAEAVDSHYTRENVYALSLAPGLAMGLRSGGSPSSPAPSGATYAHADRYEEDVGAPLGQFRDPTLDFWVWRSLRYSQPATRQTTFYFRTPNADLDPASEGHVTVSLHGYDCRESVTTQHARVSLNGVALASGRWAGCVPHEVAASFPQDLLRPEGTDNALVVETVLEPGAADCEFYIDSYQVRYRRSFVAMNNRLVFSGEDCTNLSVRGFTSPDIVVLDITDPARPEQVEWSVGGQDSNGLFSASFTNDAGADRRYFATLDALSQTPAVRPAYASALRATTNEADHVIVTVRDFLPEARRLAGHRNAQGLRSVVVDLEDVFDEFSDGLTNPFAIGDFLAYAYANWNRPPRYAVLAGNGTYDYLDLKGYGGCLIPPVMTVTPYGLVGADNPLTDVDGDRVPDIAIGRLPVVTSNELAGVIDKLIAYDAGGSWKQGVMMVADQNDPSAGNFPADSIEVAQDVSPYYSVSNVLVGITHTASKARTDIKAEFNSGIGIVNYLGHANYTLLGDVSRTILHRDDVSALANRLRPPLVCGMTCQIGRFDYYNTVSLGRKYVATAGGGAAAVWAPAHLAFNSSNVTLDAGLFQGLFHENKVRVGDAIAGALRAYANVDTNGVPRCPYPYLLDVYCLLGDPAMVFAGGTFLYGTWVAERFSPEEQLDPSVSGMDRDPDQDGSRNLMEFAMNLDPKDGVSVPPFTTAVEAIAGGGGDPEDFVLVTFRQRRWMEGARIEVEVCNDLLEALWRRGPDVTELADQSDVDRETVLVTHRVREPLRPGLPLFVRLRAIAMQ